MSDFKNCPFCGNDEFEYTGRAGHAIRCRRCGAQTRECIDGEHAIELWNKRSDDVIRPEWLKPDTLLWCRVGTDKKWHKRHFSHIADGKIYCIVGGFSIAPEQRYFVPTECKLFIEGENDYAL